MNARTAHLRHLPRAPTIVLGVILGFGLMACGTPVPGTEAPRTSAPSTADPPAPSGSSVVDVAAQWATLSPATSGIDRAALSAADARAAASGSIRSLVVVRHGAIVDERYFGGSTQDTRADIRSGTKSVMSLVLGIAMDRGVLGGPSERLDALLRPPVSVPTGPKAAITVDDLLTMRSGFEWDESTAAAYNAWAAAPNQVDYLLERPLAQPPGTAFTYDTAAVHLLSVGLSQATGVTTETYARRSLLGPLGIAADTWETDDQGFNNGGSGLALRPIDCARIGQLVLQHGASGDRQIVPSAWIDTMLATHVPVVGARVGPLRELRYGYLWWLATVDGQEIQFAWGYRGQFLVIVPALDLVVVVTSVLGDASIDADAEADTAMNLIVDDLLPGVH